jgi:hypothetical protein
VEKHGATRDRSETRKREVLTVPEQRAEERDSVFKQSGSLGVGTALKWLSAFCFCTQL